MIEKLDAALKAVCPVHGVSFGDESDKSTWRIDFKDEATDEQRAAAQKIVDTFDPDHVDPRDAIKAQLAAIDAATGSVRWIRELALGVNAAWDKQRQLQPDLPLPGTGMAKVQQIEDQAVALRKQLVALG